MTNFWDSNIWSLLLLGGMLFASMLIAHILKKNITFLQKSLIPASVLGGIIILIFTTIYKLITKNTFFELPIFSIVKNVDDAYVTAMSGSSILETITYHCLSIGFICMALRDGKKDKGKKRATEIFNTGVTTVSTYLIQAVLGLIVTMIAVNYISGLNAAAGIILALGYGQGTGQALNYGNIYENTYGFVGGANFGLAIAALGFLSASIGGVIYLNYLKRKGKVKVQISENSEEMNLEKIQGKNEIPLNSSIDKLTIQIAIVICIYIVSYFIMKVLGDIVGEGLRATIYGFNFLIGTLLAVGFKGILRLLRNKNIVKKDYINDFMMNRIGGVAFDVMIVAGIAVIDLDVIKDYWLILIIMGLIGAFATFYYIYFVSKVLFKEYKYEQFFAMYGMLTGTASTGIILLREIDPNFETPASNNLVYQNLPAIVFGLPIMFLASYAPQGIKQTYITFGLIVVFLIILLLILFREQIFKRKKKTDK